MKTAILSIILLAVLTAATSAGIIPRCRCEQLSSAVNRFRISTVTQHPPTVHCDHREVIVTLKDGTFVCLDPSSIFTQGVLRAVKGK